MRVVVGESLGTQPRECRESRREREKKKKPNREEQSSERKKRRWDKWGQRGGEKRRGKHQNGEAEYSFILELRFLFFY